MGVSILFYINRERALDAALLHKMINSFTCNIQPKLKKYKEYYDGKQEIMRKNYSDPSKPNSRVVTNYCMNITNNYCGYIATPGYISYQSNNDIEPILDVLRYNDYQTEDSDFLHDALVYGVAAELMYLDGNGKIRFGLINPESCFGIYEDSLSADLLYFVRFYKASEWDDSDLYYVDVYSDYDIKHYAMRGVNGGLEFLGEEQHYFSQCPANIFYLQDEKSIFDCIIGIQDAINEVLSSEINDFSAFCDAYLLLTNSDADDDELAAMKESRVIILPEGASAEWLTKNASDTQVENILKRLHDSAYRIAQCPDFSSESFVGGVSSGIAIQYRLTGCENRAGMIEGRMQKALQRRIEILAGVISMTVGEEIWRDISIDFKRNIPEDMTNTIALVNALKGTVSDETLLTQIPFVDDVNAEMEKLKKQKEEAMALYSFDYDDTEDEAV